MILVAQMIKEILQTSDDIVEAIEEENGSFESLRLVNSVSGVLWTSIKSLPVDSLPYLYSSLDKYKSTLSEIRDGINGKTMTFDMAENFVQLLNAFVDEFKMNNSLLSPTLEQESTSTSHFFQNAHHIAILGGNFTQNVPDTLSHKQNEKIQEILRLQYIIILFG